MAMNVKRSAREPPGSFGLLTQQIKVLHRDLLAFQKSTEQRFDRIDARFDSVEQKFDRLGTKIDAAIDGLRMNLRGIIRNALSDYAIKSKKG
jgi:hypothetical protein